MALDAKDVIFAVVVVDMELVLDADVGFVMEDRELDFGFFNEGKTERDALLGVYIDITRKYGTFQFLRERNEQCKCLVEICKP